jgi:hypothetical protein
MPTQGEHLDENIAVVQITRVQPAPIIDKPRPRGAVLAYVVQWFEEFQRTLGAHPNI